MGNALSQGQLDALLQRLGPDRELAGARYEELRRRLLTVFRYRGCPDAEDLVDETMDRVARRLADASSSEVIPDPGPFVLGVAWNVAREAIRRRRTVPLPEKWEPAAPATADPPREREVLGRDCLDRCLRRLLPADREIVLAYHKEQGMAKVWLRSRLAHELKMSSNALRLRIHRITVHLRECVTHCVDVRSQARVPLH